MSRNLYLLRHGHRLDFQYPEWFSISSNKYDPPLSDLGNEQAKELANILESEKIKHIFSSPYLRCLQTAYPIAQKLNLLIKVEDRLGEWLNAEWIDNNPKLYFNTFLKSCYPLIDRSYRGSKFPQYPETLEQAQKRTQIIANDLLQNFTGDLLIIGHSITLSSLVKSFAENSPEISTPFAALIKLYIPH